MAAIEKYQCAVCSHIWDTAEDANACAAAHASVEDLGVSDIVQPGDGVWYPREVTITLSHNEGNYTCKVIVIGPPTQV